MSSNWSHLHWSMLSLVATNLTHVNDHLAFSAVCSSWRSVALDIRPTFPCPLPYLMVRGEDNDGYCISVSNKILDQKLRIPLEDWYIGTHGRWLVTVHKNMDMSLYNPFCRETLPLPSITSVPKLGEGEYPMENNLYMESAALSSSNMNLNPKDLTVMIVQGGYGRLAFAKPGDASWQIIDNDECLYYSGVTFYKEKFYAVGNEGMVACDIGLNPKAFLMIRKIHTGSAPYECSRSYLVESQDGDLIMVERYVKYNDEKSDCPSDESWTYMTSYFTASKMDFVAQRWVPLKGIGDEQVFFVGFNSAFARTAQTGNGNRIFFTDDYIDGQNSEVMDYGKLYTRDMGVFNFSDGTISPHINIGAALLFPPPMWVIPLPW